jgi:fumarate hydratase class I
MLTGRDAAHKRIADMLAKGEKLPVDFTNRVIYYVGPVDRCAMKSSAPPARPPPPPGWTSSPHDAREDRPDLHGRQVRAWPRHRSHQGQQVRLPDGRRRRRLVAKAIKSAKVVGFADLGMEAIYEFDVQDMPVTVAVDSSGTSVH